MVKRFCLYWFPPLLAMAVLYYYSTNSVNVQLVSYRHQDKLTHFFAYAVLAFLWVRVCYRELPDQLSHMGIWLAVIVTTVFGISIEICQLYCHRHFELADIAANTAGALLGAFGDSILKESIFDKR